MRGQISKLRDQISKSVSILQWHYETLEIPIKGHIQYYFIRSEILKINKEYIGACWYNTIIFSAIIFWSPNVLHALNSEINVKPSTFD